MQAASPLQEAVSRLEQKYTSEEFEVCIQEIAGQAEVLTREFVKLLGDKPHAHTLLINKSIEVTGRARNSTLPLDARAAEMNELIARLTRAITSSVRMDDHLAAAVTDALRGNYTLRAELLRRKGRK